MARAASFGSFSYPYKKMNKLRGRMPLSQKRMDPGSCRFCSLSGMTDFFGFVDYPIKSDNDSL